MISVACMYWKVAAEVGMWKIGLGLRQGFIDSP